MKVNVAAPFQFATGVNFSVPNEPRAITWFAVTAFAPSVSAPAAPAGRVTTRTAFRLSPSSGSMNTPSKLAAVNVSAVSSFVLSVSTAASGSAFGSSGSRRGRLTRGWSATGVTVILAIAVPDSRFD